MRIYKDFTEAQNELRRDLGELAITVHPETMQDKQVADDDDYITKELYNCDYQVLNADPTHLEGVHWPWVNQEFADRIQGDLNPGHAWKQRPEVWEEFIEHNPHQFAYSYSDRMGGRNIQLIIDELAVHPTSRQLWLPVWDRLVDRDRRGKRRVPCSLGYWFVHRDNKLHVTYMMRSCDFATHYANDAALAVMLNQYIAQESGIKPGTFTHFVGSLHVYAKDVADVF